MQQATKPIGSFALFVAAAALYLSIAAPSVSQAAFLQVNDPEGDVLFPGLPDIKSITVEYNAALEKITVTFVEPVAAPSDFAFESVLGFIAIDLGRNADLLTALPLLSPGLSPAPPGIDYYIALVTEAIQPGLVSLFDSNSDVVADLSIKFTTPTTFEINLAPAAIDVSGPFAVGAIVGDFIGPTDLAADAVVPEPVSLVAWMAAACGLGMAYRRRQMGKQVTAAIAV